MEPEDRTVDQILRALQVAIPFGVETGRVPTSPSADWLTPTHKADGLAPHRKYCADRESTSDDHPRRNGGAQEVRVLRGLAWGSCGRSRTLSRLV